MTKGERIKKARETKGIAQVDLANLIGVSKQNLYKYENSIITNIPSDKIEAIALHCEVSPAYIMGWEEKYPEPNITDDYVTFPVIGDIAAGYDRIAMESWEGDTVDIPTSYLKGRKQSDFFVLRVKGDSMFPTYCDGDLVVVLKQSTLNYSGQIGAVLYDDDCATLKRVDYCTGEDWMKLVPINPNYPPVRIENEALEHCRIMGIPWVLVREINA